MTLVMAFTGREGAAMAGDMREITLLGDPASIAALERELFSGELAADDDLLARAGELGLELSIRDDKVKVRERGGALVGEVTSLEGGILRSRRVYATTGSYLIVDLGEGAPVPRGQGGAGNFVVLGNDLTKAIAGRCIRDRWKGGGLREAMGILAVTMEEAAGATPSVSRRFILVQTGEKADLVRVMREAGIPGPAGSPGSEGGGAVPGGWGPSGPSRERPGRWRRVAAPPVQGGWGPSGLGRGPSGPGSRVPQGAPAPKEAGLSRGVGTPRDQDPGAA